VQGDAHPAGVGGAAQALTPELLQEYAPTGAKSLIDSLQMIGNPLQALRKVQRHLSALTEELRQLVSKRRGESDEELQLYHGPHHGKRAVEWRRAANKAWFTLLTCEA